MLIARPLVAVVPSRPAINTVPTRNRTVQNATVVAIHDWLIACELPIQMLSGAKFAAAIPV